MAEIFLSLGSNQGDRLLILLEATRQIDKCIGKVCDNSYLIETEPWGFTSEMPFYNVNLKVETTLAPLQVLSKILEIEKKLGRLRTGKEYSNRSIDIDLLFYNHDIINYDNLHVPHPHLHKRRFVLDPLVSLIPDYKHPVLKLTISQLYENLDDRSDVLVKIGKEDFAELMKK